MIIALTGHRNSKIGGYNLPNPIYNYICQEIDQHLQELKPDKVISGMALGSDQWFAYIAMKLGIPVIAAIPFEGQEKAWPEKSQRIYRKLLSKCSEKVYISLPGFTKAKMQIRNEWMVNHCDLLIGVYISPSKGGTYNCLEYAKSIGKKILIINPAQAPLPS